MTRVWLSMMVFVIGGCPHAGDIALHGVAAAGNQMFQGKPLKSSRDEIEREQTYQAFQKQLLATANEKRRIAATAARANDCARVYAIEQEILLLPKIDIEGGYHDTVFLRDPEIVRCIDEHRVCLQQRRPECTPPPPPPPMSRSDCVTLRDEAFDRSLSEDASRRPTTLAALPKCPAHSPDDERNELAWQLTVGAAQEAIRGNCSVAIDHEPRVKQLDTAHHEFNWSRDPAISRCQAELVKHRADRERCLQTRATELRRAQTISDPQQRGRMLTAIPKCAPQR